MPRPVAGQTIIVPFDEASEEAAEPIRIARLSPGPESPPDEPTVRREVPEGGGQLVRRSPWQMIRAVPGWAWFIGTLAFLMLGSVGAVLVVIAAAAYIYLG